MARCAFGAGVGTAFSVAGVTLWCASIGRCSRNGVAGGAQGSKLARCGYRLLMAEIGYSMDDDVVAVVAGWLVAEADVDVVTIHTDGFLR